MGSWRGVVGLLTVLIVFFPTAFAQSDTEPPVLIDFDFEPSAVDVTSGPVDVTCRMTASDFPAGVDYAACTFRSPTAGQAFGCAARSPSSGDIYDGVFSCSVSIPQYVEEGVWTVTNVTVSDIIENGTAYFNDDLQQLGFPTELAVTDGNQDLDPPTLTNFDFEPSAVDVTSGPVDVTCRMTASDFPAGVDYAACTFRSPTAGQAFGCAARSPSSGDIYDGVFSCSVSIPQSAEEGIWTVTNVTVSDIIENGTAYFNDDLQQLGFPTELAVTDGNQDLDPPTLTNFDFEPSAVDVTSGPVDVTCRMTASDFPAGVDYAACTFRSPTAGQAFGCAARSPSSGDIYDGVFSCSVSIPQYVEEGVWTVTNVTVSDIIENGTAYFNDDLQQLGFPTELTVGFQPGVPLATITAPVDGRRIRGNSVTIRARLMQGDPSEVSPSLGVRFDHRALPFGEFAPIPARNPNHPNPDASYPYFIHWDVSGVPDGDYELRAVAHDLAEVPDPAPEAITITIDHAGPADVEEYVNAEGLQENQTAVDSASEGKIASGDHTDVSTATDLTLAPGSLLYTTDTAKLVYPDPADEEGQLEQVEQNIGAFVDLSLLSGQTDLEAGLVGDLNVSYADADQDGVVDGTSIREDDLELRHLDTGTNSYVVVPSIVLTEHNMVHAEPGFLGKFALAGPLMPRMWIETDKETLTWDSVSTATSYVVYRGLLSTLTDVDLDGLPDGGFGDCMTHLDGDPSDLVFVDSDDPGGGDGFYYLVGFVGSGGATGLGNTSTGLRREPAGLCP